MKTFSTPDGVIVGVFTPGYLVVNQESMRTMNFKKEDVFLDFESAKAKAIKCSGFVIEIGRRLKNV